MQNIRIEDLSAIQEKRPQDDSVLQLGRTKIRSHVTCLHSNGQNYQCPICNRLRAVCPFSRGQRQQSQKYLNVKNSSMMNSKSNYSTTINDRLRTHSTVESGNRSHLFNHFNQSHFDQAKLLQNKPVNVVDRVHYVQGPSQAQEIIFYPVVHNKIVESPMRTNPETTPSRRKSDRYIDIRDDVILTPTQFKSLMESYRCL